MNKAGSRAATSRKSGNIVDNCLRSPALEAEALNAFAVAALWPSPVIESKN
jgi:hypothetical protein